jgi:hypothetical protein
MNAGRFPKAILRYQLKGKRSIQRPMKRLGKSQDRNRPQDIIILMMKKKKDKKSIL